MIVLFFNHSEDVWISGGQAIFQYKPSVNNELENALIHNKHLIKQCLIV